MAGYPSSVALHRASDREAMAVALLDVAPQSDFLARPIPPIRSEYLPLCVQVSESKWNKNAVSIHNDFVSFMVPNWLLQTEASALGFNAKPNTERGKRLYLYSLTPVKVRSNSDFFSKVMQVAKEESISRQRVKNG